MDSKRFRIRLIGTMVILCTLLGFLIFKIIDSNVDRSGWEKVGEAIYYRDAQGKRFTGWQDVGDYRFYFDENGCMLTHWQEIDGQRYYFGNLGNMATGWQEIGEMRYYFDTDGAMHTGWLQLGEYRYYLHEDGTAATSPTEIQGQMHYFSPTGIHVWLANPWNYIPNDYEVELLMRDDGYEIAAVCYQALENMLSDCRADGKDPMICSAYRTQEYQTDLYIAKLAKSGADAKYVVAIPGTSEHQLGLAVDIVDRGYPYLDTLQEDTLTQMWLMEHCWEYGFILRYPNGTTGITGIIYEPWHYRYVGKEIAQEIYGLGITLEEYLDAVQLEGRIE